MKSEYIQKYRYHKKIFNIKPSIYLRLFEELLTISKGQYLDCSCKLSKKTIDPVRFYIWYYGDFIENLNFIFRFFKRISSCEKVDLNYRLLKKSLNFISSKKLRYVVVGVDFRKALKESRVKIYFEMEGCAKKINCAPSSPGFNDNKLNLYAGLPLQWEVDLYFDGRTKIKIYSQIEMIKSKCVVKKLKKELSKEVNYLITMCRSFRISFSKKNLGKIIHFHIKKNNLNYFVQKIKNESLSEIINKINKYPITAIALSEVEINKNELKTINVYY